MQNDQIQEPVAEADGERLRPHAVSTNTCLLERVQRGAHIHEHDGVSASNCEK